jgi:hypothetical protein
MYISSSSGGVVVVGGGTNNMAEVTATASGSGLV